MKTTKLLSHVAVVAALVTLTFPSYGICVKAAEANLRSEPSTKGGSRTITWEVFKYMPLVKVKKKGGWYKVKDFEGDYHWVHSKLVTSKHKCAVVKAKKANLRTGPGIKYKQPSDLPDVEKYTTFKVAKIKGKWAKVVDYYGDSYWVFRKLVWIY